MLSLHPKVQKNFLNITESFAETIYKILKGRFNIKLLYDGKDFWRRNNDKISCFIDEVFQSSLISAAPIGIRAGSYIVQLMRSLNKERFLREFTFWVIFMIIQIIIYMIWIKLKMIMKDKLIIKKNMLEKF